MLSFRPLELRDKPAFDRIYRASDCTICDCAFAVQYIWRNKYYTEICFTNGSIFLRSIDKDGYIYSFPMGVSDIKQAVETLENHCAEEGHPLKIGLMTKAMAERIEEAMPGAFAFTELRDCADYLYTSEKMINLAGKKLHAKRNFINRFKNSFEGRWSFEALDPAVHLCEIHEYESRWYRDNRTSEGDLLAEKFAISNLLENLEALEARGGVLRLDGKIIGFTLGTYITGDIFCVHIEKAEWEIPGAYQILNNEFAKLHCADVTYINREDDMGIEGLRQAKLSYHPDIIEMKYIGVQA